MVKKLNALSKKTCDPNQLLAIVKEEEVWKNSNTAMYIEDIQRLVTEEEIEMLKFVLFLVCRNIKKEEHD